ncbi:MAG: mannosyltransferase family protein [Pyrinomonadaceae bacterium]
MIFNNSKFAISSINLATCARQFLSRALLDRSVRQAFFAWALSRFVIFAVMILVAHLTVEETAFGGTVQTARISLHRTSIARSLRSVVRAGDSWWHAGIAEEGYEKRFFTAGEQHNWAFFPLYPLLLRAAARITGGYLLTGMLLSSLLFFFALVLLHKTAIAFGGDAGTADRAIFYTAFFPVSYFFSLPMTESLFLLLSVGSFYAAKRNRWWMAGSIGALASATRAPGIILLPALFVLYLQQYCWRWRWNFLSLFIIPSGLLAFMFYLHAITLNAFAFMDVQAAWGRQGGLFLAPLYNYLRDPLEVSSVWDFKALNFIAAATSFACSFWLMRRREWSLAVYALLLVVLPLSSLSLQSLSRYTMVNFPVLLILGFAGRSTVIDQALRTAFITLLALLTALYTAHFSFAMV